MTVFLFVLFVAACVLLVAQCRELDNKELQIYDLEHEVKLANQVIDAQSVTVVDRLLGGNMPHGSDCWCSPCMDKDLARSRGIDELTQKKIDNRLELVSVGFWQPALDPPYYGD